MTLVVDLAFGIVAGVIASVVTLRWPRLDPTDASLAPGFVADEVAAHPRLRSRLRHHADPHRVMGALLIVALIGVAAMTLLFGLVSVMVRTNTGFARFDRRAAAWGAAHASHASTRGLRVVSMLGGTQWGLIILAVVALIEIRRTRRWAVASFLALCVVGQNVIVNTTKVVVERARPSVDQLTGFSGYSFPSGHSAQAASMFAAIALVFGRGRSVRVHALLAGVAIGIAVAVAASRVLLGVHWLTDVIAGLAVGWGWFAAVSTAFGGRWLHFGAPIEAAKIGAAADHGVAFSQDSSPAKGS